MTDVRESWKGSISIDMSASYDIEMSPDEIEGREVGVLAFSSFR